MTPDNTVFLRLEGPLQAWGVTSRFVIRDTADVPSKSGVLGLVCAVMGLSRVAATNRLATLATLWMGVRIDRPGQRFTDYHTAGAKAGLMTAGGKIKETQTTGEIEAHVMRKEYLADASFLVALQGDKAQVAEVANALQNPVWPPFLGRKSCPPSAPVFAGVGMFDDLEGALRSHPWRPRLLGIDTPPNPLRAEIEVAADGRIAADARPVQDVPRSFTHRVYGSRFVRKVELLDVDTGNPEFTEILRPDHRPATTLPGWAARREERLESDHRLCVFCKSPARDVHHVTYERAGAELQSDLRSVCQVCHDALTLLEYAGGMGRDRIDPCDSRHRDAILSQRASILTGRNPQRRSRSLRTEEE